MEPITLAILVIMAVLILLIMRVPISFVLGGASCLGLLIFFSWHPGSEIDFSRGITPTLSIIGVTVFEFVHNYPLSMIPLFIALGHISYHAGITTDLYNTLRVLIGKFPGGLAMASTLGCGGFSAISGSSVACAAAMGKITVPEMLKHGYNPKLACAAAASGGTLGSLIPPSLLFIIYAVFTEQSVKWLFLAGVVPGLLSLIGYLLTIYIWSKLRPQDAPLSIDNHSRLEKLSALKNLWPVVLLLIIIIGGIFAGVFTPTEAAGVSLIAAFMIGLARKKLTRDSIGEALVETVKQTSVIFAIAIGAKVFVAFASLTQIAPSILAWVQSAGLSVVFVMLAIIVLYLILGMFLDSIGILVLTLPFVIPIVEGYGLDLIWFGVIVIKLLEIGLITPPVGLNTFVIKAVSPKSVSIDDIFKGIGVFLILDFVVLIGLILFPFLSLTIPRISGLP